MHRSDFPRVIVLGTMGRTPFAGVAWQALHYLEGFRRLGCEVWYVEDTGTWAYDPEQNTITAAPGHVTRYVDANMRWLGLGERWVYVSAAGEPLGPAADRLEELLAGADALVNLTGGTVLRERHLQVPVRIYLETDPVLPQIEVAQGRGFTIDLLAAHTHHFSYGENLGAEDCLVPVERFSYRPTRQPVILDWWPGTSVNGHSRFTTVASWRQTDKDIEWQGDTYYWSKDREFEKLIALPRRLQRPMELALACGDEAAIDRLRSYGWRVRDALALTREIEPYRDYLLTSRGEFTVAKDQNVRLRSGWFSDRSACYLAAGKPVVTQDTGFGNVLPTGEGLFSFRTEDEALAALQDIERDYARHASAAREIAREHFAAERVLGRLLDEVGVPA
ncbi:MAG: glycosyltransferase [Solirubrobacteraceae bacterium]